MFTPPKNNEHLPSKYDVVELNAHWRWRGQLISQGDRDLNILSS